MVIMMPDPVTHTVNKENAPNQSNGRTKKRRIISESEVDGNGSTKLVFRLDNVESLDLRKQQQEKLTQMSLRIQELEKAIAELVKDNPASSSDPSSITGNLSDIIQLELSTSSGNESTSKEEILNGFLLDDRDMLDDSFEYSINHLQNDCNMELYGPTGASEDHMRLYKETTQRHILITKINGLKPPDDSSSDSSHYPPHIFFRSLLFPCPPRDQGPLNIDSYTEYLPSYERARALLNNYLYHFSWSCLIVAIDDVYNLITYFYPSKSAIKPLEPADARKLSLLCTVFLIGTLFDLDLDAEAIATQAELFHLLVRASLASHCFSVETTVEALQSLILLIWFYRLSPGGSSSAKERWILSGPILKLIQGIGLDRNSRQYLTDAEQCNRFEQLFWEYNVVDIWQSFALGRPTTVPPISTVCQLPRSVKPLTPFKSEFYIWKYDFARLLAGITSLGVERPAVYADVLKFEKQIKTFHEPISLEWHNNFVDGELPGAALQRFMVAVFKQLAILYLHRPYFWHATSKSCSQHNALVFSHSIAMVYNSASTIVTLTKDVWHMHPKTVERVTPIWRYCETATLMLGVLVIRNPDGPFAENAVKKIEDAGDVFRNAKESFLPQADIQNLISMCMKVGESFAKASRSSVPESSAD